MHENEIRATWKSHALLEKVRAGDQPAAEVLFSRYCRRLTSLARSRLSSRLKRRTDPEDVVQSVFRSFFFGARAGRFTLSRKGDLWRLLASITKHKLLRQFRHASADCRAIGSEVPLDDVDQARLADLTLDPTPENAFARADELEWILAQLDSTARRIFELRLQGAQLADITRDTGRSERTIRRSLAQIRELIARRIDDPAPLLSHQDFDLRQMIGAGQMGKVYRAWQHSTRRFVAVKFLRKSLLHEPRLVERFIGESRVVARLNHPNIVRVHGLGRTPGGSYFIAMDLVDGPNLADLSKRRLISVPEAIRWTIETCLALEHAHASQLIHCDLKPANLLLDESERVRLTDFGLARSLEGLTPWAAQVEGTGPFMAPEQVSPAWGDIDVRTDVYGVGAVLFTLLTGRPPWIGARLSEILAQVTSPLPVIDPRQFSAGVPEAVSALCRKCLSKASRDRFESVHELRSALLELIEPS